MVKEILNELAATEIEAIAIAKAIIDYLPRLISLLVTILVIYLFYKVITHGFKKLLIKKAKTKKQQDNVIVFLRMWKYLFVLLMAFALIFVSTGSLTAFGISAGLLTAALGWALQRPITGIAGWIMVVAKKPFVVGDRIIIGNERGDVSDITLTHIYLKEIGGVAAGEENSGRVIMVPNSVLFEKSIINYTLQDEYVLDQVVTTVTFESNLDKAIELVEMAAKKHMQKFLKITKKKPYALTYFDPHGMKLIVRYFSPASRLQEFSSKISKEIYDSFKKVKSVELAYPHTEVLYRKK